MLNVVQWRYVLPRIAIAAVVCIGAWMAVEPLLHSFLTRYGERIVRAKIDIDDVNVKLANADLTISGTEIFVASNALSVSGVAAAGDSVSVTLIASDGTVWFSDSSTKFGIEDWKSDFVQHTRTGRLCRLDPDGTVTVVIDGLAFANGVALSKNEDYVCVA